MTHIKMPLIIAFAGLILVGAAILITHYARDIKAAHEALNQWNSQVIETDCGAIEIVRTGEGYPLLVVHGAFGGYDQGLQSTAYLTRSGFQIIAISRFGYLGSPIPEKSNLDEQSDLYACLLDTLGIQQAGLYGISGGASSILRFATRYPERTSLIVLQSPAAPGEVIPPAPPKTALSIMGSDFVYWAMITFTRPAVQSFIGVPKSYVMTPETEADFAGVLATTLPSSRRISGFVNDFYGMPPDEFFEEISETSPYSVRNIHVPTLLINSLDDPMALPKNVRHLADLIPGAQLFLLPDGGHLLLGHKEEIQAEVTRFLRSSVPVAESTQ